MKNETCDKLIIAILQNDDYRGVIANLNEHGYYVTVLQSSGGFLRKPSATIMMGLNHEDLPQALELLKKYGRRTEMEYATAAAPMGMGVDVHSLPINSVPIPVRCGGVVYFVMDVDQFGRF